MANAFLYKTTNTVNGKYYIGVHSSNDDHYLGSGKLLKRAIKKYGRNCFEREIIKTFDSVERAYKKEREIVNEGLVKNRKCYNVVIGGGNPPTIEGEDHHNSKLSDADRENICVLYMSGMSTYEISEIYDLHPSSIWQLLKNRDVEIRSSGSYGHNKMEDHHMWVDKNEGEICKRYKSGETTNEIGNDIGVSGVTVGKVLKRNGVKRRKPSDYLRNPVLQIKDGKVINKYESVNQAKKETGIYHIGHVCRGERMSAGGYEWKYKDDMEV